MSCTGHSRSQSAIECLAAEADKLNTFNVMCRSSSTLMLWNEELNMPRARGQPNRPLHYGEVAREIVERLADDNSEPFSEFIRILGHRALQLPDVRVREDRENTYDISFVRGKVFVTFISPIHPGGFQGTNLDPAALTIQFHGVSPEDFPYLELDGSPFGASKGLLRRKVRRMEEIETVLRILEASYAALG